MKRRNNYDEDSIKPFNNTLGLLERINARWDEADHAKMDNDVDRYYNALECIFRTASFHFNEDEVKVLKQKCRLIERFIDATSGKPSPQKKMNVRRASNLCDDFSFDLAKLLGKYNLEWLDIKEWRKYLREKEEVMRA